MSRRADPRAIRVSVGLTMLARLVLCSKPERGAALCFRVETAGPDRAPAPDSALVLSPATTPPECAGGTLGINREHTPGVFGAALVLSVSDRGYAFNGKHSSAFGCRALIRQRKIINVLRV